MAFLYIEFRGVRLLHHSSNILPIKQKFGIQVLVIRTHALVLLRLVCSGLSKTETWANVQMGRWNAQKLKPFWAQAPLLQSWYRTVLCKGGACVLCGWLKRPYWVLSYRVSLTESPWVEGMVWGTSQGAWLDPPPAACGPLEADSSSPQSVGSPLTTSRRWLGWNASGTL